MTERQAENNSVTLREFDTPLTRAIDACNFEEAIRIIKAYGHGRHINEGPNGEKPLQKVLLTKPYCSSRNIVHLQIAKLLVLAGANANLGTPSHIEGVERDTPFEALISIMELMEEAIYAKGSEAKSAEHFVCFGLQGEPLTYAREVCEQALQLLHLFLECDGDPNLVTMKSLSTVFHLYLSQRHVDVNTVMKFHAAGADLNKHNNEHITPLMALIMAVPNEMAFSLLCEMWPPKQQHDTGTCDTVHNRKVHTQFNTCQCNAHSRRGLLAYTPGVCSPECPVPASRPPTACSSPVLLEQGLRCVPACIGGLLLLLCPSLPYVHRCIKGTMQCSNPPKVGRRYSTMRSFTAQYVYQRK